MTNRFCGIKNVIKPGGSIIWGFRSWCTLWDDINRGQINQVKKVTNLKIFLIVFILLRESYPLTPLPDDVGGGVITEGPMLHLAMWTPKGHGLITVKDNDIFYRPAPRSSTGYRVTDTGIPGRIYNGIPDWLYEGNILLLFKVTKAFFIVIIRLKKKTVNNLIFVCVCVLTVKLYWPYYRGESLVWVF